MKGLTICRVLVFIGLILMMGVGVFAHAAKLGLASAWLFEENGGKVVKWVGWLCCC